MEIIRKFMVLTPMAIGHALLNGFYEEFFFLGLLTSVKEKHQWLVLVYSVIIRISTHTYQDLLWALVIGLVYGLFYYFLYKYVGQEFTSILYHACSCCRYVWFKSLVSLNCLGKLGI